MPPSSSRSHGAGAFLDEVFKRPQGWSYTAPSFHELLTGDHSGGSKPSVRRRVERARLVNLDVRIVAATFEPAQMVECGIAVLRVRLDHQHRDEIDGVLIHYRGATAHFAVETIGRSGRSWLLGRSVPDNPPLDLMLLDGLALRAERKHFDDLQIAVAIYRLPWAASVAGVRRAWRLPHTSLSSEQSQREHLHRAEPSLLAWSEVEAPLTGVAVHAKIL